MLKKLPIGEQTFSALIRDKALYVDKTEVLYNLLKPGRVRYFFSRPRRFGKSLTCSTFEAIFSGNKELFKDLWIGKSDYEWVERPVVYFDFSGISHETPEALIEGLNNALESNAAKHGIILKQQGLKEKFSELITNLSQAKGPVALIIDEYDKPITNLVDKLAEAQESLSKLRDFYGTLKDKDVDANLHFLFVTGVSKFSKIALFSELNNLDDLTNDARASALVGYTDYEVDHYLSEHIQAFADESKETYEKMRKTLKAWYNGYRFTNSAVTVYNPFSLHNCLTKKSLDSFWFSSGTPNFLIKFIQMNPAIASEIETIDGSFLARSSLESFTIDFFYQQYKTLLLQTGYLTFASDYDANKRGYKVAYPNEEVRYAMVEQIMHFIGGIIPEQFGEFGDRFRRALAADDLGLFCKHLQDFIKLVPHNIKVEREKFYQQVFFMICTLFGKRPVTEVATEEGFMDLLLEGTTCTFVVEFKRNSTPDNALKQIEEKRYWESFEILTAKKIILAGIAFNQTEQGTVVEWKTKSIS